ncbi:hypothetical protein C2845_PM12G05200 [Panicum miliaceum]|uniref:Uncharacterized protein n=1 Tax=Panicum miliaceum TaxID=4540 RepID=A0A3L6QIQ5_PANMI|nr:hypothetical protein C2845_PM12G05200 [Panicum miliaceum]
MASSTRVCLLLAAALAVACALLATPAAADAAASVEGLPPSIGGTVFGCNPATDKTCKPDGPKLLPGGGIDIDGDGDEDELPGFDPHFTILGHAH